MSEPDGVLTEVPRFEDPVEQLAALAELEAEVVAVSIPVDVVEAADVWVVEGHLQLHLSGISWTGRPVRGGGIKSDLTYLLSCK